MANNDNFSLNKKNNNLNNLPTHTAKRPCLDQDYKALNNLNQQMVNISRQFINGVLSLDVYWNNNPTFKLQPSENSVLSDTAKSDNALKDEIHKTILTIFSNLPVDSDIVRGISNSVFKMLKDNGYLTCPQKIRSACMFTYQRVLKFFPNAHFSIFRDGSLQKENIIFTLIPSIC